MTTLVETPNDPLTEFKDGAWIKGSGIPMPLADTAIDVRVLGRGPQHRGDHHLPGPGARDPGGAGRVHRRPLPNPSFPLPDTINPAEVLAK